VFRKKGLQIFTNLFCDADWSRNDTLTSVDPPISDHLISFFLLLYRVRYRLFSSLQVAVNGSHLLEYRHRIELKKVDTLAISGKVQIQAIGFIPSSVSKVTVHLFKF